MIKYLQYVRKIHRIFVLIITTITLIMASTGMILKYSLITFIDPGMVRYIHNNMSPWLAICLFIMIITGASMYFAPWLVKLGKKD